MVRARPGNSTSIMGSGTPTNSTTPTTNGLCVCAVPENDGFPFSFASVCAAYEACRKGKRNSRSAIEFELRREENLFLLWEELRGGTWRPSPSFCFVTKRPKHREIFAAPFRDRVVHHLVVSTLEPIWDPGFIYDSWACRKGKGTHGAVYRLQSFLRSVSGNGSQEAWFLHVDIRSYFVRIDKSILLARLMDRVRSRRPGLERSMEWLLGVLVGADPTVNSIRKGDRGLFARVPPHKSLFHTGNLTGLPIGNYTSQFFANVYLDALDQHAKHTLRIPRYIRYVDDIVMASTDPKELLDWEESLGRFLSEELKLEWNHRARRMAPVAAGCDFLGYTVWRNGLQPRRRTVGNCRERLEAAGKRLISQEKHWVSFGWPGNEVGALRSILASYEGQFRHCTASAKVWRKIWNSFPWLTIYFEARASGAGTLRFRFKDAVPKHFRSLREQYSWFARRYSRYLLFFRIGSFYEFFGANRETCLRYVELQAGRGRKGLGPGVGLFHTSGLARKPEKLGKLMPVVIVESEPNVAGNVALRRVSRIILPRR